MVENPLKQEPAGMAELNVTLDRMNLGIKQITREIAQASLGVANTDARAQELGRQILKAIPTKIEDAFQLIDQTVQAAGPNLATEAPKYDPTAVAQLKESYRVQGRRAEGALVQ